MDEQELYALATRIKEAIEWALPTEGQRYDYQIIDDVADTIREFQDGRK